MVTLISRDEPDMNQTELLRRTQELKNGVVLMEVGLKTRNF